MVAGLGAAAGRLSLAEAPAVRPAGLIASHAVVPGWTVVCGYDRLMTALGELPGAVVAQPGSGSADMGSAPLVMANTSPA